MKWLSIGRTFVRYWNMAQDPRTPSIVRFMIYGGIAYTLMPVDLIPDWIPGIGLLDDAAVLPSLIALALLMTPKEVKAAHGNKGAVTRPRPKTPKGSGAR
jgi:uncharacterized membrane protein YkvA (DUF1232 family)